MTNSQKSGLCNPKSTEFRREILSQVPIYIINSKDPNPSMLDTGKTNETDSTVFLKIDETEAKLISKSIQQAKLREMDERTFRAILTKDLMPIDSPINMKDPETITTSVCLFSWFHNITPPGGLWRK